MTKRKTKVVQPKEDFTWAKEMNPATKNLRCVWHTQLNVPGDQTVSGKKYSFQPGEVQPVDAIDAGVLLALIKIQKSCCGAPPGPPLKYFQEA